MPLAGQLFPTTGLATVGVADFGIAAEVELAELLLAAPPVDVGGAGHPIAVAWPGVLGATRAAVTSAALDLVPAVAEEVHAGVAVTADGAGWTIAVPPGRRVRAIGVRGLRLPGGEALTGALPDGMRLSVAFPRPAGGGFDAPRFAVPAVGRAGAVPPTLTGASFADGVVRLDPAVRGARVRLALVTGAGPAEFADQATELDGVQLVTHTAARQARVTGPDGAVLWQSPELDPEAPTVTVDLRQAIEGAFTRQLAAAAGATPPAGSPVGPPVGPPAELRAELRVTADAPARLGVRFGGARGALVRVEPGVVRTVLAGDPVALALAGPLADETPSQVVGGLTVRYDGVRLLETASDALPAPGAAIGGAVVGERGVVRAVAPGALAGRTLARLGVFGRAPEEGCELVVELVAMDGAIVGAPLAPPAVLAVPPEAAMRGWWVTLPPGLRVDGAAGVRLRCNTGRFFWAHGEAARPVVRVAIADPDPGGRGVFLGGVRLATVRGATAHEVAAAFPTAPFRGRAPRLASELWVTVDCSDLTLRYAR